MKTQIIKILLLLILFIILLVASNVYSQTPTYTLIITNDQQIDNKNYEFDIYLLKTGTNTFEYANNSQYFINYNPAIINGGTLSFTIDAGTCELNAVQQILQAKLSVDAANSRLRIAAHSPSGAGTGSIISGTAPGTRLGRFRVTNTVSFAAVLPNLSWYNGPAGFFTKVFAYVGGVNAEITNPANHFININNSPLPVEISSFNAFVNERDILLRWVTEREINNSGFGLERKNVTSPAIDTGWESIVFIRGNGTTETEHQYTYTDKKLAQGKYKFRLMQRDFNGNTEYFNLSGELTIGLPVKFKVSQNYPNPSNPKSKIDYQVPGPGKVVIKVYDIAGREVSTIEDSFKEAGYYTAEFDGTNLASGVYFYKIMTGNFSQTKKMILVK